MYHHIWLGEKKWKGRFQLSYPPPALLHHIRPPPEGESAYGTEFVETADTHLFFQPRGKMKMIYCMPGKRGQLAETEVIVNEYSLNSYTFTFY